ncbi:MAG: squalene synthase HpnC [Burkholderiales bacterium]|nr:squalene synthase HpnC [Burkholderiales bacterium]
MGVDHYENFPVASALCPPALRPAVVALYRFARCADDLADEGDAAPAQRLADLAAYRADLAAVCAGAAPSARWAQVFGALGAAIERFALPGALLGQLLDAFEQDVRNPPYRDRAELLDYCRRSANPVGRLLLHLYGVGDALALRRSDAICTALQLINFWQDLGVDAARARVYVPAQDRERAGVALDDLRQRRDSPAMRALVRELCAWAEALMREGAPLALALPGRGGWELRLVVQGGLRILDKIAAMDHATLLARPSLGAAELPVLAWRALRMKPARPAR